MAVTIYDNVVYHTHYRSPWLAPPEPRRPQCVDQRRVVASRRSRDAHDRLVDAANGSNAAGSKQQPAQRCPPQIPDALPFCIESEITSEERRNEQMRTEKEMQYQQSIALVVQRSPNDNSKQRRRAI
jgi:hypothetical protein